MKIVSLHIYPVKSLGGISCSSYYFDSWGPENDRRWMVVAPEGRFLTQRQCPLMATIQPTVHERGVSLTHCDHDTIDVPYPDQTVIRSVKVWKSDVMACDAGDGVAQWLTAILKRPCRLVYMDAPQTARPQSYNGQDYVSSFADGFPGLVCNQASLEALNQRLAHPVPMERFRPNLVISGAIPWEEDQWGVFEVGEARLKVVKPCSRCLITTVDQQSGTIPHVGQPLKELGRFRRQEMGIIFGQNVIVEKPGYMCVGDEVRFL